MKTGWIYVLSNPSMPNLLKVGKTTRKPEIRVKELNGPTGVPTPFQVELAFYVTDCHAVEKAVHNELKNMRINARREFFAITPRVAKRAIERGCALVSTRRYINEPLKHGL